MPCLFEHTAPRTFTLRSNSSTAIAKKIAILVGQANDGNRYATTRVTQITVGSTVFTPDAADTAWYIPAATVGSTSQALGIYLPIQPRQATTVTIQIGSDGANPGAALAFED
ncbi:MAG TPA: hypothetical protein VGM23_18175 [Armatimonadota bacterium]